MLDKEIVRLKVTGKNACFTRPDLKVERMSYPCMTPSAARGILDAILWKPEFQWVIRRILVLNPIKFSSIKRNEINSKQKIGGVPIDISLTNADNKPKYRAQRNSLVLNDVSYIIEASVFVDDKLIEESKESRNPLSVMKYRQMFNRRAKKGQCWHQPFLGTREFSAEFSIPSENDSPAPFSYPIGSMLYDMFYTQHGKKIMVEPQFFYDVAIIDGVLNCPLELGMKMLKSVHIQPNSEDSNYNRIVYNHYQEEELL